MSQEVWISAVTSTKLLSLHIITSYTCLDILDIRYLIYHIIQITTLADVRRFVPAQVFFEDPNKTLWIKYLMDFPDVMPPGLLGGLLISKRSRKSCDGWSKMSSGWTRGPIV